MDLYQELAGQNKQRAPSNNFFGRLSQFAQTFKGNPKEQVEQILKSGSISQEQYNNAVNQANMIYGILNKR